MENKNVLLRDIYTYLIIILGFYIVFILFSSLPSFNYFHLTVFILLTFAFSLFETVLPSGMYINLAYPLLMGVFLLKGPAVALLAVIPALVASGIRRKKPIRILFNIAQLALTFKLASLVFTALGGEAGMAIELSRDWPLLLTTLFALDVFNNGFVSTFFALDKQENFWKIFINSLITDVLKIIPIYYTAGILLAVLYQSQGIIASVLISLPLISVFFIMRDQEVIKKTRQEALTDSLTGLYNRRFMDVWLEQHFQDFVEEEKDLAVLMIDIDDFKDVNDEYGHQAGDLILQELAKTLKTNLRVADVIFRYGGEEFVIMLPRTSKVEAVTIGERLRESVASMEVEGMRITVSIGLACLQEETLEKQAAYELLRQADRAAYTAKYEGKNRVLAYT